ncbi:MAG: CXXX repeat peptide maturase [Muribaculaceae bacterium]|nr:CXXX repeat peptide maturase [Muribaculaceae bacterium]
MLQYLVILLDDTSASFCHYHVTKSTPRLMPLDTLKRGIRFGMIENLMIQFIYPNHALPQEYLEVIDTIDHSDIKPLAGDNADADIIVTDNWESDVSKLRDAVVVLRTCWAQFREHYSQLNNWLAIAKRLNVVVTDVERLNDDDREQYKAILETLSKEVEKLYVEGKSPQFNLLTDRMVLTEMNNCNAGDTTITLAPDGKFYICPAFYYDGENQSVGDLDNGLDIKNRQLYSLDHAPICRKCDAWQCRRCVWLNRKTTLEVNTPSHEQCVAAHLERNASRKLMLSLRSRGTFLPDKEEIKELTYLDPFEIATQWN